MKIMTVKEYNRQQYSKWHEDCRKWSDNGGLDGGGCMPQIAFYLFYTLNGSERQFGYVVFNEHRAVWNRTKKGAIEHFTNY